MASAYPIARSDKPLAELIKVERLVVGDHCPLPQGKLSQISNGLILDLRTQCKKYTHTPSQTLYSWLGQLCDYKPVMLMHTPQFADFKTKLDGMVKKQANLFKNKSMPKYAAELAEFLAQPFSLPLTSTDSAIASDRTGVDVGVLIADNEKLKKDKRILIQKLKRYKEKNAEIIRGNTQLNTLKHKVRHFEAQANLLRERLKYQKERNKLLIASKHVSVPRVDFLQQKSQISALKDECSKKNMTINKLESIVAEAEAEREQQQNGTLETRHRQLRGSPFTEAVRNCVYDLKSLRLSDEHIGEAMQVVSKHLFNRELTSVPTRHSVNRMQHEMLHVSQQQMAEVLSAAEHTTINSDETSKLGQKFIEMNISTETETVHLMLHEFATKSAADMLTELIDRVAEIDQCCGTNIKLQTIANIANTMSDQAATQKKFTNLLEAYKTEILPLACSDWDSFSAEQKQSVASLNSFFCNIHIVANSADVLTKQFKAIEQEKVEIDGRKLGADLTGHSFETLESIVTRLVRAMCKAFGPKGDEKAGCQKLFKTFLDSENYTGPRFARMVGNRFNILMYNGGVAYALSTLISQFLKILDKAKETNRLTKCIAADLSEPLILAELQCLGLVNKTLTGPLWRLIEEQSHIFDLQKYFVDLIQYLNEQSSDPAKFLAGEGPFSDDYTDKDFVYSCLIENDRETEVGEHLVAISARVMCALGLYFQESLKDYLEGGKYWNPSELLCSSTKSVQTTNTPCESAFGCLDSLLRFRPNSSDIVNESAILFAKNHTSSWLLKKSLNERNEIIQRAMQNRETLFANFQKRQKHLVERRQTQLDELKERGEKSFAFEAKQRQNIIANVIDQELAQSVNDIERSFQRLPHMDAKRKYLRNQIMYRQKILNQPVPVGNQDVFKIHGKTLDELRLKLIDLINSAEVIDAGLSRLGYGPFTPGRRFVHVYADNVKYEGIVISSVPGFREWINVKYDTDEAIYTHQLMRDLEQGTLEFSDTSN